MLVDAVVDQRVLGRSGRDLGGSLRTLAILAGFGPELAETCNVKTLLTLRPAKQEIKKTVFTVLAVWGFVGNVSGDSGKGMSVPSLISGFLADLGGILAGLGGPWRSWQDLDQN